MSAPSVEAAEQLYTPAEVERALDRLGAAISRHLAGDECLALCMLQGGIIPAGLVLPRIEAPVELDSVHVTRYRNRTWGGTIEWRTWPRTALAGRCVLLIDDILDEGHTLAAVRGWCIDARAAEVLTMVLVDKRHGRKHPDVRADFVGLEVPDRYVYGYGMDYGGWHRNARGIFALPA